MYKSDKIIIEEGSTWRNMTSSYLTLALYNNSSQFLDHFRLLYILGCAINDRAIKREQSNELFIVVDVHGSMVYGNYKNVQESVSNFYKALAYFKQHDSYVMDYPYDSNKIGNKHVIVFKVDPVIFDKFIKGQYSEMYDLSFVNKYVPKVITKGRSQYENNIYNVLTKNPNYRKTFLKQLNLEFGTTLTELDDRELDLPPIIKNETLRW